MSRRRWIIAVAGPLAALLACEEEPQGRVATIPPPPAGRPISLAPRIPAFYVNYELDATGQPGRPYATSPARSAIMEAHVLEQLVLGVNQLVEVRRSVPITMGRCGRANAYYDPQASSIRLCDEMVLLLDRLFAPAVPREQARQAVVYATAFTVLHEVGHALVDQLELPVTGAEEDVVDQFATFLLVGDPALEEMAIAGAAAFGRMYRTRQLAPFDTLPYWDEHSLPEQRWVDINCLVFGSDPGRYVWMVRPDVVPAERAERCPGEWARVQRSFGRLLQPHLRQRGLVPAPGQGTR